MTWTKAWEETGGAASAETWAEAWTEAFHAGFAPSGIGKADCVHQSTSAT